MRNPSALHKNWPITTAIVLVAGRASAHAPGNVTKSTAAFIFQPGKLHAVRPMCRRLSQRSLGTHRQIHVRGRRHENRPAGQTLLCQRRRRYPDRRRTDGPISLCAGACKSCKESGHIRGSRNQRICSNGMFLEMTPFCDCFYFDCKADSALHSACTGVEDTLILQNLDAILRMDAAVVLRCPIVPGANLTEAYLDKIVALAQKYPNMRGISLLPYHKAGAGKSIRIGKCAQTVLLRPVRRRWRKSGTKFANASPFPYSDAFFENAASCGVQILPAEA